MNKAIDTTILIKSLQVISNFGTNIHSINSSKEFLEIHNRNIAMLTELALERNSEFIKNQITQYPVLNLNELDLYISTEKKEKNLLSLAVGDVVTSLFNFIKNKGVSLSETKNKLKTVATINEKMIKVVEDPIFEEVYIQTEQFGK
ncbi:hypothetical protein [Flavobacterium sp. J27]|uniref:hypothetical protein n=1 Tax=Flavobacterium sp. J27 TaxID=2060419 RepID=UPI00103084C2|nr:hypothetical protein [Flavobacterium sp. J27]